jgi:hypothetical protein
MFDRVALWASASGSCSFHPTGSPQTPAVSGWAVSEEKPPPESDGLLVVEAVDAAGRRLPREASSTEVAKDGQHNNDDDDDPKPGRHVVLSLGAERAESTPLPAPGAWPRSEDLTSARRVTWWLCRPGSAARC